MTKISNCPHKDELCLISLTTDLRKKMINKGYDPDDAIKKLKGIGVDVCDLTIQSLSKINQYRLVIIICHHIQSQDIDALVLSDNTLLPVDVFVNAISKEFTGLLDLAICQSKEMAYAIKALSKFSDSIRIQYAEDETDVEFRLCYIYPDLLKYFSFDPIENYRERYRNTYLGAIEVAEREQNERVKDINSLPEGTKLGDSSESSNDSVKTSVFMPEEVTRGEFFKLQIKMHLDIDTGTLYFKEARGNDPNTAPRQENVAIKNIKIGDELLLNLCFLDAKERNPTKLIIVEGLEYMEDIYLVKITINDENPMVVLNIKVTNDYPDSKFITLLRLIKENECLIEFDLETGFKTNDSQNCTNIKRSRGNIGENQNKLVRDAERERVPSIEQMKQLEEERRERILHQLLAYVNSGNWKRDEIASKVEHMLLTILGKGEKLNDKEAKMSEQLWKCLENVRIGKKNKIGRVGVVWQNIIGYLDDKGLFKPTNSPALNIDFFNTKEGYPNIDKGRPSRGHLSYWFQDIIELLNKYCPQIE